MSYKDEVLKVLDDAGNVVADAAAEILSGPKKIALYVIQIGLETIKSKRRRDRRRELRSEVRPQFKAGPVTGSIVLTKQAKERVIKNTRELFGADGWMIGDINIGAMTKEQLLAQAHSELASAKGSIRNAQFYEALADPLQPGQRADSYWKPETATKIKRGIWKHTEGRRPDLI